MKKSRKACAAALCAAAMFLLAGCQPTPETEAVTSKNDGAFQAALQTTAAPAETADSTTGGTYTASFTTTDGNTEYTVSLDIPSADTALPVLRVTPEAFSAETVQQAARALFGDADIYEYSDQQTKDEIEEQILSLKQQAGDRDALEAEFDEAGFGADVDKQSTVDSWIEMIEEKIAALEAEYQTAPETVERVLCDFTFHPHRYYEQSLSEDSYTGWDVEEVIEATAEVDGLTYELRAENFRSGDDQTYSLYISLNTDDQREALYRETAEPTQEEIDSLAAQAEALLASMGLGEWVVDSYAVYGDDEAGYALQMEASPVYNGLAVTNHLYAECYDENATSSYTFNYNKASITLQYIGGTLDSFGYDSPVAVAEVTNDNVQTLTFDEVMEKVQTNLSLRDTSYYATHSVDWCCFRQTGTASVTIDRAVLGLTRIQVQDSATDYYLVPSYTFYGSVAMFDESGNPLPYYNVLTESETDGALETELLTINAVDGSVIDTTNYIY